MDKQAMFDVKVIPLIKREIIIENDKIKENIIENLSRDEIKNMSCKPRMLNRNSEDIYFAELPIQYHGTKIKWSLFYIFDELTDEEKIKYDQRSDYISVTKETVVELYTKKVRKKKK